MVGEEGSDGCGVFGEGLEMGLVFCFLEKGRRVLGNGLRGLTMPAEVDKILENASLEGASSVIDVEFDSARTSAGCAASKPVIFY